MRIATLSVLVLGIVLVMFAANAMGFDQANTGLGGLALLGMTLFMFECVLRNK